MFGDVLVDAGGVVRVVEILTACARQRVDVDDRKIKRTCGQAAGNGVHIQFVRCILYQLVVKHKTEAEHQLLQPHAAVRPCHARECERQRVKALDGIGRGVYGRVRRVIRREKYGSLPAGRQVHFLGSGARMRFTVVTDAEVLAALEIEEGGSTILCEITETKSLG